MDAFSTLQIQVHTNRATITTIALPLLLKFILPAQMDLLFTIGVYCGLTNESITSTITTTTATTTYFIVKLVPLSFLGEIFKN